MKRVFFAIAVAAMTLVSCNQANTPSSEGACVADSLSLPSSSSLAYVSVEMVVSMSEIYTTEGVALQTKTQKAQESWAKKEQGFQYEASQLQEKYQKGLITTANAQKEQESLESRMRRFQTSAQSEAQGLDEENRVFSNRTQDLVRRAVDEINSDGKYKMIVNASALIDADTTLDISMNVLEVMNNLYAAEKSSK